MYCLSPSRVINILSPAIRNFHSRQHNRTPLSRTRIILSDKARSRTRVNIYSIPPTHLHTRITCPALAFHIKSRIAYIGVSKKRKGVTSTSKTHWEANARASRLIAPPSAGEKGAHMGRKAAAGAERRGLGPRAGCQKKTRSAKIARVHERSRGCDSKEGKRKIERAFATIVQARYIYSWNWGLVR